MHDRDIFSVLEDGLPYKVIPKRKRRERRLSEKKAKLTNRRKKVEEKGKIVVSVNYLEDEREE